MRYARPHISTSSHHRNIALLFFLSSQRNSSIHIMRLSYAVIGTGALGGFYGGKLAQSGKEVHFLLNRDYDFVKKNGLRIDSASGNFQLKEVQAHSKTSAMPQCDVILVCLKTISNSLLKSLLPPLIHRDSTVILIQNGLGAEEELAGDFPDYNIAGGLAFICSHKKGPGYIAHLDYGRLTLGNYQTKNHGLLQQVCEDFKNAGIETLFSPNLAYSRWQKLVWNIPFNGMTVVLNTTTDKLMNHEDTRQLSREMMLEVIHGANHCGYPLEESYADQMIEMTEKMTPYAPSMKLDFDANRPMEIEYIYSRPFQTALKAGYQMKKVGMLEKQLKFIQANKSSHFRE
jgi:2-dehydropantoate 2-reductase